ncbi:MAG: hypothetical protein J6I76_17400 [Oribacterium sp.]|nr:hypothetical protein [Oribacterium sp.]
MTEYLRIGYLQEMLKYEFGIMMVDSKPGQIFEEYEPEKYDWSIAYENKWKLKSDEYISKSEN